jgi:hypothetical protein
LEKSIVTTFMLIAGIVIATLVFNVVYPAVVHSGDALINIKSRVDQRLKTQVVIVHAAGELDASGTWQDTNGDGDFDTFVWVKNVGSLRISAVDRLDVFFGPEGNFTRIPYVDEAGGAYPYWTSALENDTNWNPTATLKITIHSVTVLSSGRYFIKVVTPNGMSDSMYFGM